MYIFEFQGVTKRFSEQYVLNNFSYVIKEKEKVRISGRSGLGKTTLFRLLLGFEKPDSGKILYNESVLENGLFWELRKQISYVSQDLNIGSGKVEDFFHQTVSLKANIKRKKQALSKLNNYLDFFELPVSFLSKNIEELSGGEKQRIAIINALLLERKIYFLDEITSALDNALKIKTMDYFLTNSEFTVLFISHDDYLPEVCDIKNLKL